MGIFGIVFGQANQFYTLLVKSGSEVQKVLFDSQMVFNSGGDIELYRLTFHHTSRLRGNANPIIRTIDIKLPSFSVVGGHVERKGLVALENKRVGRYD